MITLPTQLGGCGLAHSSRQNDASTSSVVKYNGRGRGRGIATLPNEMFDNLLSYLNPQDVSNCRCVSQRWKKAIDDYQIMPRALYAFYRRCHPQKHSPNPYTVEHYDLSIKGWLNKFSCKGKKLTMQLNQHVKNEPFPQMLCWSVAQLLRRTKAFCCESIFTIEHSNRVINACFSPDGKHLVIASWDKTAKIYGLNDGQWQEKATIKHDGFVNSACFSPDGKHLVTASCDNTAKIWGLNDGQWQEKATIKHDRMVNSACFSLDGKHLVTASKDKTAKIYGLNNGQWQAKTTIKHDGPVNSACFSPDGKHLVTASKDKTAVTAQNLLRNFTETLQQPSKINTDFPENAFLPPNFEQLHTAKIYGVSDGQWQEKATIQHSDSVINACFSADGKHLVVTASCDNTAKIYELIDKKWQEKATIKHNGAVLSACFSPDGKHLVTASSDDTAKIYGLNGGQWQEKATIQHNGFVRSACFSPDGKHLVTASEDRTAKIYGVSDGQWQEKATIQHGGAVNSACFSPDGKHLVTASEDRTAKIYGVSDGQWQKKATIQHGGAVNSACFSPDGKYVMTTSTTFGANPKFVANVYMLIDKKSKGIS